MALQAVIIIVAMLLLWGSALVAPQPMTAGDHPAVLYGLLCDWLMPLPRLAVIIALLLILTEGIMLNLLLANVGLVSQNSLLPTLLYIVAVSAGAHTITPLILVNGCVIACLNQLFLRGTLLTILPEKICGATVLIGIATLFYRPAIFLMVSYLLIASNYRLYSWKDWALMILGFAAPYVLLVLILYLAGGLAGWWQETTAHWHLTSQWHLASGGWRQTVASFFLAATFLWGVIVVMGQMNKQPVVWQKNATTTLLLALGGIGMMLYTPFTPSQIPLFAVSFAFCSYRMLTATSETGFRRLKQHTWIYDTVLILTLIAALLC